MRDQCNIKRVLIFGHIRPFIFLVVAIFIIFFGHVQQVIVRRCHFLVMIKVFGHDQSFWSYRFGHIDSVMLTTLLHSRAAPSVGGITSQSVQPQGEIPEEGRIEKNLI